MKLATIILALLTASIFADEMPMEAQRLKLLRDNEVDKIEEKYQKALLTLRDKYAKAGRFEDAKKVDGMVVKRESLKRSFKWGDSGILHLYPDGSAAHSSWKSKGSWIEKQGLIELKSGSMTFHIHLEKGIVHCLSGGSAKVKEIF